MKTIKIYRDGIWVTDATIQDAIGMIDCGQVLSDTTRNAIDDAIDAGKWSVDLPGGRYSWTQKIESKPISRR